MHTIHCQIHGEFTKLVQLQPVDLHHQIEGGALGLLSESHPDLGIDIWHDHFSILIGQGDP